MDLTNPDVIASQLAGMRWRSAHGKRFGQNFLVDRSALERIVLSLALSKRDVVVEIGPGLGVLTRELARSCARVIAIEKDQTLLPQLKANVSALSNVEILHADALTIESADDGPLHAAHYILTGNLPYSIAVPVVQHFFLSAARMPARAVFLLQKEVAERLAARAGDRTRGALSVVLEARLDIEIIARVPAESFLPVPAVDGAVIRMIPRDRTASRAAPLDSARAQRLLFAVFRHRRKQIHGPLSDFFHIDKTQAVAALASSGIDPHARPQELTLAQWSSLFRIFML